MYLWRIRFCVLSPKASPWWPWLWYWLLHCGSGQPWPCRYPYRYAFPSGAVRGVSLLIFYLMQEVHALIPVSRKLSDEAYWTSTDYASKGYYRAAHSLARTARHMSKKLWRPVTESDGIRYESIRVFVQELLSWKEDFLNLVGVPSNFEGEWDFVSVGCSWVVLIQTQLTCLGGFLMRKRCNISRHVDHSLQCTWWLWYQRA